MGLVMKCALRAQLEEKLYISTSPFTRCAYNGRCGNNTKAAILDGVIYSGAYQRAARASWSAFKVHWSRALSQALPFICNDAERQPRTGGVQIDVLGEIISQKWNGEARFCNIFVFFALWFFHLWSWTFLHSCRVCCLSTQPCLLLQLSTAPLNYSDPICLG